MDIIITEEAIKDLNAIIDYISLDNSQNALKVWQSISQKIDGLSAFPNMGVFPKDKALVKKGYRMIISDNYLIFYVVLQNQIEIRKILHGSRLYKKLFED